MLGVQTMLEVVNAESFKAEMKGERDAVELTVSDLTALAEKTKVSE